MSTQPDRVRWRQVQEIFQGALERPALERDAYLAQSCGTDEELRQEVASLLAHDDASAATLHSVVAADLAQFVQASVASEVGLQIGPYHLIRELDAGGMGVVYLGVRSDEHYFQFVAVKLLRAGMSSPALVQRFRSERQILATLSHPNIGAILDGGDTADGRPYMVMEYVEGQPITEASRTRGLGVRERVELLCAVCAAVHYAHQKSIIHRDIKPSNVLVTPEGMVKLIDFGISKPIGGAALPAAHTPTEIGQRLLTPDYASPEQLRGEALTTATDVYSLGVLLYELLSGSRPYILDDLTPAAAERLVCEGDVRPPSAVADLPPRTRRELAGDLDRIVLMAMEKDPARRYASAQDLHDDLRRFLRGEPVQAREPVPAYRLMKLVRRHPTATLTTFAMLLTLAGSVLYQQWQSRAAASRVSQAVLVADAAIADVAEKLQQSSASVEVQASLFRSALAHLDQLRAQFGSEPRLLLQLSRAYQRVGDLEGSPFVANLGKLATSNTSYEAALRTALEAHKGRPDADSAAAIVESYQRLGGLASYLGDLQRASDDYQQSLLWARTLPANGSRAISRSKLLAAGYAGLGSVQLDQLAPDQALRSFRAALQALGEPLTGTFEHDRLTYRLYWYLGQALTDCCTQSEAIAALRNSLVAAESAANAAPAQQQGQRALFVANYYIASPLGGEETLNVGDIAAEQRYAQRALVIAQVLLERDPQNAQAREDLGHAYEGMGDAFRRTQPDRAAGYYREAIAAARAAVGSGGRRARFLIAARDERLAAVLPPAAGARLQLLEEANGIWLELTRSESVVPLDRVSLMRSYCRLAEAELALHQPLRARGRAEAALPFFAEFTSTSPSLTVLRELGFCFEALGDVQAAFARDSSLSATARRAARVEALQWYQRSADTWQLWESRGVSTPDSDVELRRAQLLRDGAR
jgi:serine/threonine protein kinase